jgi:Mn-dependent DtxR family transcriptional regulator
MSNGIKKFDLAGLSHSAAHHLMAVASLLQDRGYARVVDIGRELNITRGSVCIAMQSLKQSGYVDQDDQHFYHLTEKGARAAAGIRTRHKVVERFLVEVLGMTRDQSHQESCKVENIIDGPTTRRLARLVEFWQERGLDEEFAGGAIIDCPADCERDEGECPCCGLECVDDNCLAASRVFR